MGAPLNILGYSASPERIFRVRLCSTVWTVTCNDAFYGDYLTRAEALAGACAAACAVDGLGGAARVIVEPGGKVIAYHRRAARS
jgi:hypothetical protein